MSNTEERRTSDTMLYRRQQVDERLDGNEQRISRLEKGGLLVFGYMVSEGGRSIQDIITFLL